MNFPPPSDRQARIIWLSLTTLALALGLTLLGTLAWGLGWLIQLLSPVIWPLAVAVVLAYLLSPVVNALEDRGISRFRSVVLVFAAAGFLMMGVVGSVVPRAIVEARDLASQVPTLVSQLQVRLQNWLDQPQAPLKSLVPLEWRKHLEGMQGHGRSNKVANPVLETRSTPAEAAHPSVSTSENGDSSNPDLFLLSEVDDPSAPWWVKALNPDSLKSVGTWFAAVAPDLLRWAASQIGRVAAGFSLLAGLFLVPVYAFFFLLEEKNIARSWTDYLPVADEKIKKEAVFVLRSINDALIVFFRGQVLVAFCDGILYALGFIIIGIPYALLIGLMACFVTIIPFLGAAVTCGTALIIALVQYGDWQHPVLVMVVFGIVQVIEGLFLQPRIVGDRVGLHPLMVIIALMVGTTLLGGILGGLLAIPLTAALRVMMAHYVWKTSNGSSV